jgi:hypothetical protein
MEISLSDFTQEGDGDERERKPKSKTKFPKNPVVNSKQKSKVIGKKKKVLIYLENMTLRTMKIPAKKEKLVELRGRKGRNLKKRPKRHLSK